MSGKERRKVVPFPVKAGHGTAQGSYGRQVGPGSTDVPDGSGQENNIGDIRHADQGAIRFSPNPEGGLTLSIHLHPEVADMINTIRIQDDVSMPPPPKTGHVV